MDIRNTIIDIHNCVMDKYEFITRTLKMGDNLLPWPRCQHILSIKVENVGSPKEPPKLVNWSVWTSGACSETRIAHK